MKKHLFTVTLAFAAALCAIVSCNPKDDEPSVPTEKTPSVPRNLTLTEAGETSLSFSWDAADGAESYAWRLTKDHTVVTEGKTAATSQTVDGLQKGTAYSFAVRSIAGDKTSAWSNALDAVTPDYTKPEGKVQRVDDPLVLELGGTPVLGKSGKIVIYRKDGEEVDRIDLADLQYVTTRDDGFTVPSTQITNDTRFNTFMDALPCTGRWRAVHYTPLKIQGNKLIIRPHTGVLEFGTEYYVTIDAGVLQGHEGVSEGLWPFATSQAPESHTSISVGPVGDFCTIQRALDFADKGGAEITIANGTYHELLYARDKSNISLKGESRSGVVISYPNCELYVNGSGGNLSGRPRAGSSVGKNGGRSVFLVENCDNLVLQDLSIENSFGQRQGQAETIYFNSGSNSHRLTVENCSLLSYQDTFLCKGVVWVHNSLIAGAVDYIWGSPSACLFEDCEIRSRANGYIIQARVPGAAQTGFVFLNCSLTAEEGVANGSMYLARSAGQADGWDNVVFVNCKMSPVINQAGWYGTPAPNPSAPTASAGWREFGSTDLGGKALTGHNSYGKVLTAEEAAAYSSRQAVLGF